MKVNIEKCISCGTCVEICKVYHGGVSHLRTLEVSLKKIPIFCKICGEEAPCIVVCPENALYFSKNGVHLNTTLCTHCNLCILVCPFGAITENVFPCDNCQKCALFCPMEAIEV